MTENKDISHEILAFFEALSKTMFIIYLTLLKTTEKAVSNEI